MTGRRRVLLALLIMVVAGGALAVGLAVAADDEPDPPSYTAETRRAFMTACTERGGDDVAPECECFYEAMAAEIPYERYREVSDELLADPPGDDEPLDLPDDFAALLRDCRTAGPLPGT